MSRETVLGIAIVVAFIVISIVVGIAIFVAKAAILGHFIGICG